MLACYVVPVALTRSPVLLAPLVFRMVCTACIAVLQCPGVELRHPEHVISHTHMEPESFGPVISSWRLHCHYIKSIDVKGITLVFLRI